MGGQEKRRSKLDLERGMRLQGYDESCVVRNRKMEWKLKGQIRLFGSWGQQISRRGKILIEVAVCLSRPGYYYLYDQNYDMDGPWILGLFLVYFFGDGLRSTLLWIRVIVDRDLLYTLKFKLHIQVVPSP
jgi:hypothetical protein